MTLLQLMDKANKGYPDGILSEYYDRATGKWVDNPLGGDTLAKFVAIELNEAFGESASDEDQLYEACRVIQNAVDDLNGVLNALS